MGQPVDPKQNNGKAKASLICGIVSLIIFGIILGPVAICLGVSAKNEIQQNPETSKGKGLATGGIVRGSIGLVLHIVLLIIIIAGSGSSQIEA